MNIFWLFEQFGWQLQFLVVYFSWKTLISEAISAGYPKVAVKILNWLGTRSHRSHLSGALIGQQLLTILGSKINQALTFEPIIGCCQK